MHNHRTLLLCVGNNNTLVSLRHYVQCVVIEVQLCQDPPIMQPIEFIKHNSAVRQLHGGHTDCVQGWKLYNAIHVWCSCSCWLKFGGFSLASQSACETYMVLSTVICREQFFTCSTRSWIEIARNEWVIWSCYLSSTAETNVQTTLI